MRTAQCHRFFFALLPPRRAACEIERLSFALGGGRRVLSRHLHMTLAITGDFGTRPAGLAERMMRMPADMLLASFALELDRLSSSGRSLALCPTAPPDRLRLLQAQLERALRRSCLLRPEWTFSPHLTLLYRHDDYFFRPVAPIGWQADELALVHSHVGLTRHDVLKSWPLSSGDKSALAA